MVAMLPLAHLALLLVRLVRVGVATVTYIQNERRATVQERLSRAQRDVRRREVRMLEGIYQLHHCRQCGGRPGPDHVIRHSQWLAECLDLEQMFTKELTR